MALKRNPNDFIYSAFDDYLAARLLLLNKHSLNGVILASLAIEKYLKAMLASLNIDFKNLHLDRLDEIKQLLADTEYKVIFNYVDPRFLELLSLGYRFRYYDNIKVRKTIGFATHQVLAELDCFISVFEQLIILDINGKIVETPYQRAVSNEDPQVFDNNYVLNKLDRQTFYEQETYCFGLDIDPEKTGTLLIQGEHIKPTYNGQLTLINIQFESEIIK